MKLRYFPRTIRGLVLAMALVSGVVTVLLAMAMILVVHWELERQLDQRIEVETHALLDFHALHGFDALAQVVALRDRRSGTGDMGYLAGVDEAGRSTAYILVDPQGKRRAGAFSADIPPPGWSEFVRFRRPGGGTGVAQAMNTALPGGGRLIVAADRSIIDQMHWKMLRLFIAGYGALLILGMAVTIGFGRAVRRRLTGIEASAEAIMAGDLSRRMPLDGSGGEFDRLSLVLNRMLDRMGALLDNLRQVSGDIAHDLRTPLQRVRNRLEDTARAVSGTPVHTRIDATIAEMDALLDLFSSLLAISEIEGQSIRARFTSLNLYQVIDEIVDIYQPTVEDQGRTLKLTGEPVTVRGDGKLLQRVIANLLDNALLHAPGSTFIHIAIARDGEQAIVLVHDDGPGIPEADRERVFRRLTRLDASRSTPGHGLGLNLVAAIVAAHGGSVTIDPAPAGLAIRIVLPLDPASLKN